MLPFSLGPRGCIGQHLALAEMHLLLPLLARHGDITVDGPIVERPIFTLRVEGGLRGRFTPAVDGTAALANSAHGLGAVEGLSNDVGVPGVLRRLSQDVEHHPASGPARPLGEPRRLG